MFEFLFHLHDFESSRTGLVYNAKVASTANRIQAKYIVIAARGSKA